MTSDEITAAERLCALIEDAARPGSMLPVTMIVHRDAPALAKVTRLLLAENANLRAALERVV
jgi:hypothetical protein